jgi:hypothetical protein
MTVVTKSVNKPCTSVRVFFYSYCFSARQLEQIPHKLVRICLGKLTDSDFGDYVAELKRWAAKFLLLEVP